MEKLAASRVAVFGAGGVGGCCIEALARSGVGAIDIIDGDRIDITNLNRQIIATRENIGGLKCEAAKARVLSVNPECRVTAVPLFFLPENADGIDFSQYDYVADCVDTITAKLEIIVRARAAGVGIITAMGAGNKTEPTLFRTALIEDTKVCPLARVMRRELKKRGISGVKCVYSEEEPRYFPEAAEGEKPVNASIAFVPTVAGLIMAGEIIKDLMR